MFSFSIIGAGDVITALVASGSPDGISYNIGSLFGAGLFVCSIIVAITILISPVKIQLTPASIWRDVGLYIVAGLLVVVFGLIGSLSWWSSVLMLLLYFTLVLIVYVQEKFEHEHTEHQEDLLLELETIDMEEQPESTEKAEESIDQSVESPKTRFRGVVIRGMMRRRTESGKKLSFYDIVRQKMFEAKYRKKKRKRIQQKEQRSLSYYLDLPFEMLEKATLPTCDFEHFSRFQCILFPIVGCFLMTFFLFFKPAEEIYWNELWLLSIPVGALFSLFFYFMIPKTNEVPPRIFIILQLFGTAFTLIWTYFVSGILIDILTFIGTISGFPSTYMGLTVIAVGNALPDGVTTIVLAKKKLAIMGMTGAYAGQLFGLLVGFGLSMLKKTLLEKSVPFDLFNPADISENIMDILVICVSLFVLSVTFLIGVLFKYELPRLLAYVLLSIYSIFIVIASGIALNQMIKFN